MAARDLPCDECLAADRRFVVKEYSVAGMQAVSFAVVDSDPVGVQFCNAIGASRIERCLLRLRHFLHQAVELAGGGLVYARLVHQSEEALLLRVS